MKLRFAVAFALLTLIACDQNTAEARETAREASNKAIVLEFYEKGLNQKDADAASTYLGPRYTQHNPSALDGPEGFRKFVGLLKTKFPLSHGEVKQVFADGDFVILHSHVVREPDTRGSAVVDIFKLESGKIVEHRDVIQEIPERTASGNAMF